MPGSQSKFNCFAVSEQAAYVYNNVNIKQMLVIVKVINLKKSVTPLNFRFRLVPRTGCHQILLRLGKR